MTESAFARKLINWFRGNRRNLPWRVNRNMYRVWVSEVMLQQTQVDTVIPYFNRFMERFPDITALAAATQEDVLKLWEGLGYYGRARNLHKAAQVVMTDHAGIIPDAPTAFRKLPGVGDYICAAVMSISAGHAIPVVDGNVLRVTARYFGLSADITKTSTRKQFSAVMASHITAHDPGEFNEAVMELGALVCTPRSPRCRECPLSSTCVANRDKRQHELPVKSPRSAVPIHHIVVALLLQDNQIFVQRRPENGLLGGLWEFPGGKVEDGETLREALKRECMEELGIQVSVDDEIGTIRHAYTHFKIVMTAFRCSIVSGKPETDQPSRWISTDEIKTLPFPKANHKLFPAIYRSLGHEE